VSFSVLTTLFGASGLYEPAPVIHKTYLSGNLKLHQKRMQKISICSVFMTEITESLHLCEFEFLHL